MLTWVVQAGDYYYGLYPSCRYGCLTPGQTGMTRRFPSCTARLIAGYHGVACQDSRFAHSRYCYWLRRCPSSHARCR